MNLEETQKINKLAHELKASNLVTSSQDAMKMAQTMLTRRVTPEQIESEEAKHETHHANMDTSISNLSSEVSQLALVVTNLKEAYSKMISEVDDMRIKAAEAAQAAQAAQEAQAVEAAQASKVAQEAQVAQAAQVAQVAKAAQEAQAAHAIQAAKAVEAAKAAQAASEAAAAQKSEASKTPTNTPADTIDTPAETSENDKKEFSAEDVAVEKIFYFGQK